jgi:hypothetical protein
MVKTKTKKIVFRVEEPLSNFITDFSRANGMTVSELCRNVMVYFHTGFLMGEFRKSLPKMKADFLKKFKSKKARKDFLKKYKPQKFKKIIEPFDV